MKGSTPTKPQKEYWDALANDVGCIACAQEGIINSYPIARKTSPFMAGI